MILYWSTVVFNILSGIALTYGIVSFTLRFFIKRKNLILFNHYEKLIKKFPIIMNHGFLDNYANYHNSLSQKDRDFSVFNFWRLLIANRKLNRINHSIHSFIKAYKKNKALTFSSKDLKKHSAKDLKKYRVFIPSFFDILNINIINKEIIYHLESIDFSSFSRGLVTFNFNLEGYNYDILPPLLVSILPYLNFILLIAFIIFTVIDLSIKKMKKIMIV